MPIAEKQVLSIICDNPACPGNSLPKNSREGWTIITSEVYGQPSTQHVYCCAGCAATIAQALDA